MRRSNLSTLRKHFEWVSDWNCNIFYIKLLYKDLFIIKYLTSIFKILRFPTSNFTFNYNVNNYLFIYSDILIPSLFFLNKRSIYFKKKYYSFFKYFKYYKKKIKIFNTEINIYNSNIFIYIIQNIDFIFFEISYFNHVFDYVISFNVSILDFLYEYKNDTIDIYSLFYIVFFIKKIIYSITSNINYFFFKYINFFFFSNLFLNYYLYYSNLFLKNININLLSKAIKCKRKIFIKKDKLNKLNKLLLINTNFFQFFNIFTYIFKLKKFNLFFFNFFLFYKLFIFFYLLLKKNIKIHFWIIKKIFYIYFLSLLKLYLKTVNYIIFYNIFKRLFFNLNSIIKYFLKKKKYVIIKYFFYDVFKHFMKNLIHFISTKEKLIIRIEIKKITKLISYYLLNIYINSLILSIEYTILFITKKNCVLLINFFFKKKPFIKSSKLINDYIFFKLRKKISLSRIHKSIKKWQIKDLNFRNLRFYRFKKKNLYNKHNFFINEFNFKFFNSFDPLIGIRILCSGTFYKGRRKLRKFYHLWVADFYITGRMPLNTYTSNIEYYQSSIPLKHASLGIKVWVLLYSKIKIN